MFKKNIFEVIERKDQEFWQLEDIKKYLRISNDYDDNLIKNLIDTAITAVENFTNLSIYNRHIKFTCNFSGKKNFELKYKPVNKILKIAISCGDNAEEVTSDKYYFDIRSNVLFLREPINQQELILEYICGFDVKNIPSAIKHGILMHVAEIYDREENIHTPFSLAIKNLYLPYKQLRV